MDIGFKAFILATSEDLAGDAQTFDSVHKPAMEIYAFLLHWLVDVAENHAKTAKAAETAKESVTATKGKKKTTKAKADVEGWNWDIQRCYLLETVVSLLKLEIQRIIISTSERDTFISMITKSVCFLLEDPDSGKNARLKNAAFSVLGLAAKKFDSGPSKNGMDFSELTDGILREVKDWEFTEDDSKQSKSFAKFIIKLSEVMSERVLKNMISLQGHMDSDSYVVRNAMLEVLMNLIHLQLSTNNSEAAFGQMISFYNIIEERFADKNSFVRSKVLQVLLKLAERRDGGMTDIPVERWKSIVSSTVGRLHDKASVVRKNAIKLLAKLIESCPFLLNLSLFERNRAELKTLLKEKFPDNYGEDAEEQDEAADAEKDMEVDTAMSSTEPKPAGNPAELASLRKFLKYYSDGVRFLRQIKTAMPILCELLSSNTKTEVIECMRFFTIAFKYDLVLAKDGTRKMIHKIWEKDASGSDEEGSIRDNLLKCWEIIYMNPMPDPMRSKEELVANNLIGLIQELNLAEIISLEQLLGSMMQKSMIPDGVMNILWSVFASRRKESLPGRRRGALAILSMFGKAKKEIIEQHKDALLVCGLGEHAQNDLLLAKYACVALQQLGVVKKQKGLLPEVCARLPMNDPIFTRLCQLMLIPTKSYNWFGFAEQAINTIYSLSEHPDSLCGHVLQVVAERIFQNESSSVDEVAESFKSVLNLDKEPAEPVIALAAEGSQEGPAEDTAVASEDMNTKKMSTNSNMCDAFELSKLCFLVGHIGIRQIAHLEAIEQEWKRRKATKEKTASSTDELEQVTGTAEDEFTDAIAYIREMELLFGQNSLLSAFGPMITNICSSNISYNAPILQVMAVLALCKLMCISSKFCDENLQLLFTILEKSTNPIIRSNIIIGLGDMAVSFNSLIDQNISYLYNRLTDTDPTVKKNTLMVLTHLILNGMVKVKGQISEMAKCLEDGDKRISDLAKLFFTELATKDNAIYNNMPDIISNLSHNETGVDEEQFRSIMKFLFEFLKKDKQNESIIEKLCLRFKNAEEPRLWRDIAFCISLVSFTSEKTVKKLMDALPLYQDKLHEPLVYKYIHDVILRVSALPTHKKECCENEESIAKASGAAATRRKRQNLDLQLDTQDEELDEADEMDVETKVTEKKTKPSKRGKVAQKKRYISDGEDEIEEEDEEEDEMPLKKPVRGSKRK
ncbi:ARM repeat-containing protein [Rhizoclosmatium globosum]|uniref:Condensin complex subunit 1 n=1 Tax=Rhizoclosmatium globosum TaxID=329046 RepID=A0A1Y2CVH0_9FUNG|nr:ARM repeat-containing protein [Rhizoclosmatium globosum]|eukprot:ORY51018.1 ARM repeat-containing protein [Rhizoclosmatium globosum]